MRSLKSKKTFWLAILVSILISNLAIKSFASSGPIMVTSQRQSIRIPLVVCKSKGQVCKKLFVQSVITGATLKVGVMASRSHCSTMKMRIFLDGTLFATSTPLSPGKTSKLFSPGLVAPGLHEVAVQAVGLHNGCDTGTLNSWSGKLIVSN